MGYIIVASSKDFKIAICRQYVAGILISAGERHESCPQYSFLRYCDMPGTNHRHISNSRSGRMKVGMGEECT